MRIWSRILQLYTLSHRNNAHPDFRLHGEHHATIFFHLLCPKPGHRTLRKLRALRKATTISRATRSASRIIVVFSFLKDRHSNGNNDGGSGNGSGSASGDGPHSCFLSLLYVLMALCSDLRLAWAQIGAKQSLHFRLPAWCPCTPPWKTCLFHKIFSFSTWAIDSAWHSSN